MFLTVKKYFSVAPAPVESEDLDHYKIFKPLYTVLTLLGLFPYSIKFNKVKHEFTIVPKSIYVNSLCAVSTMLFIYTFIGVHIQYLLSNNDSTLSDVLLTQMNYIIELDMLVLCSTIAYISSFTNRFNYVKILNDLSSVWIELKNDSSNQVLRSLRFHINVVVMGSLSIVFVLQIFVNSTRHDSIWKIILVTFSFILPHMVQIVTMSFYYTLVVMMVSVLENANEHTMKFIKGSHNIPENCIKVEDKLTIATLRQMEMVYAKSFEIKRDINAAFQAFILVTTVQCFHSIISEAFIIYHGVVLKTHDTHSFINCSVWILYQFLKIYSLAYSGNLLKDKKWRYYYVHRVLHRDRSFNRALQIGQSLHSISTEKLDIRTLLEIQHFSTSMNYQGTLLTVYGYFTLDATLMSSMIASVTMYLIILVQFDRSHAEPHKNCR